MIILIALNLKDYSDSDWARDVDDRNSITSFFFSTWEIQHSHGIQRSNL